MKKPENKNINIPNTLSVLRIVILPFFIYFFYKYDYITAMVLLGLSGLTDLVDGIIARKFNQITELGKMLDPLADKITQGIVAICLAARFSQIKFILILFVIKELLMLVGAIVLLKKKKRPCAANWYGKVATFLFYISVVVIVAMNAIFNVTPVVFEVVANALLLVTAAFMLYSLYRYMRIFFEILKSDDEEHKFNLQDEIKARKEK